MIQNEEAIEKAIQKTNYIKNKKFYMGKNTKTNTYTHKTISEKNLQKTVRKN